MYKYFRGFHLRSKTVYNYYYSIILISKLYAWCMPAMQFRQVSFHEICQ